MKLKIYLNGKFVSQEAAKVSVFDHGLLYGDGVFEGIRSYNGLVFKLEEHIKRLYKSAQAIMLKIPLTHPQMVNAVIKTLRANRLRDAYIRLVVTRGIGDLGLDPRKCHGKPTIVIIADKIKLYPEKFYKQGLEIIIANTRRNVLEALSPEIKSLNYLNNILAKVEASKAGVEEAIMLNYNGHVAECTGDNIFIVKKGRLFTPPVTAGILKGITRQAVLDIAERLGIMSAEKTLITDDLFDADECFLTGTAAEIVPVVKIDKMLIGSGKPGEITFKLRKEFGKLTQVDGARY